MALDVDRPLPPASSALRRSPAVVGLALLLAAGFGLELFVQQRGGAAEFDALISSYGLVPREFVAGRWFTLATAIFLHAGWLHLGSNLGFLALFGPSLEVRGGPGRFLALFFGVGFGAGLAHVVSQPEAFVPAVGASGSIAGLLGAHLRLGSWREGGPRGLLPGLLALGLTLGLGGSGVAVFAHLAGFAGGWLSAPHLFRKSPQPG